MAEKKDGRDPLSGSGSDYPDINTSFIEEEIKKRPLNRRKMVKRMSSTAVLAAVFGAVACLFFLILEPVLNKVVYPEETQSTGVTYPEETPAEEITPEEIRDNEEEKAATEEQDRIRREVEEILKELDGEGGIAERLYGNLKSIAEDASPFLVDVAGITSDTDWFNDPYETRGTVSGFIIAINGNEMQVLVNDPDLPDADRILVTLNGGATVEGTVRSADSLSGFAVLSADISSLDAEAREQVRVAELGTSSSGILVGQMAIAVGRPTAAENGIAYGAISSIGRDLEITDSALRQMTAQIYAGSDASGVLINLSGQIVGVIDMSRRRSDMPGTLCAIGVSELKDLIEKLSAGETKAYLGIQYADVPEEIRSSQSIPDGIYVSRVEDGSPAMNAGLQVGDIISEAGGTEVFTRSGFTRLLLAAHPGDHMSICVMRHSGDGYSRMNLSAELE